MHICGSNKSDCSQVNLKMIQVYLNCLQVTWDNPLCLLTYICKEHLTNSYHNIRHSHMSGQLDNLSYTYSSVFLLALGFCLHRPNTVKINNEITILINLEGNKYEKHETYAECFLNTVSGEAAVHPFTTSPPLTSLHHRVLSSKFVCIFQTQLCTYLSLVNCLALVQVPAMYVTSHMHFINVSMFYF